MRSISASGVKRQLIDLGATLVTGRLAVLVGQHLFGITTLQKTPAHEGAQDATA
jgi:hypothetical protein